MDDLKIKWKNTLEKALSGIAEKEGIELKPSDINLIIETPPKPELGDAAFPLFPLARIMKKNPAAIATDLVKELENGVQELPGKAVAAGPYVNIKFDLTGLSGAVIETVLSAGDRYGYTELFAGEKIMVEFSCPNTNKPLHLGHLRNDAIGESISRILKANGAEVRKVNLINDRGVHICKSMLAYKKFGNNSSPESTGRKGDHFVGDYYVKFNSWAKEEPSADKQAQEMLKAWEEGDSEVLELWETMNGWTLEGLNETYEKTGVSFDEYYYESKTYLEGKKEVLKGYENGVFLKEEDGSIWADLTDINLDKKVLLRSDGTSLYLTQDIGTAISRHRDWDFRRLIYVVGSEQQYHFQVLFHVLKKLGFEWADSLYHLSYGMVNLPEGKMKSREGTVVDGDDLVDDLIKFAKSEIESKNRTEEVGDLEKTAESVALAALNYFLLQVNPSRDMVFNPRESIAFSGNTGPYLQYMGARISSMLRKYEADKTSFSDGSFKPEILVLEDEREIIKLLSSYAEVIEEAGKNLNPSLLTSFLYELSKTFSRYYHDNPVLQNKDHDLVVSRIMLVRAVLQVLKNSFFLLGIPFVERM